MGFHAECKARSQKLQLTPVKGRDLWKKKIDGKLAYYTGADTEEGYELALSAYLRRGLTVSSGDTISSAVEAFLSGRTRGRSFRTTRTNRQRLGYLTNLFGSRPITDISGLLAAEYHRKIDRMNLDPRTCYHIYRSFVSFVEWSAATYDFDIPRNLKLLGFNQGENRDGEAKSIDPSDLWTLEDFRQAASYGEWWELITLLCLNCGFTNTDLDKLSGHLDVKHGTGVDWEAGRIVHKRNKTKRFQNSPKVNYKLWPRTLELLKKFASHEGVALLLNGRRLQTPQNDHLSRAWKKTGHAKQLKFIRKTGATALHGLAPSVKQVYLCDKSGIADSAYVYFNGRPHRELDAAVESLGREFEIGWAAVSCEVQPSCPSTF